MLIVQIACVGHFSCLSDKSHVKCYIDFCTAYQLPPVPATPVNICRYITFLCRTKAFSTIQQYLSIIRLLHLELGLPHPYQGNHQISSLMKAVKRVKGNSQAYKLSLSLHQIKKLCSHLDLSKRPDAQTWCIIACCFYGLLRIGSVTVQCQHRWDTERILTRGDVTFTTAGCILALRHSKTNQFREN